MKFNPLVFYTDYPGIIDQRSSLSSNSSREQIAVLRPTTAFYSRDGANLMSSDNFQKTLSLIINELLFYYSRDGLHEANPKASGTAFGLNCAASFEQPAGGDAPVGGRTVSRSSTPPFAALMVPPLTVPRVARVRPPQEHRRHPARFAPEDK